VRRSHGVIIVRSTSARSPLAGAVTNGAADSLPAPLLLPGPTAWHGAQSALQKRSNQAPRDVTRVPVAMTTCPYSAN